MCEKEGNECEMDKEGLKGDLGPPRKRETI